MKLLIKYTVIVTILLGLYSLMHTYGIDMLTYSTSYEIMGIFLVSVFIYLSIKWYKAMQLEETFVNIQFIED